MNLGMHAVQRIREVLTVFGIHLLCSLSAGGQLGHASPLCSPAETPTGIYERFSLPIRLSGVSFTNPYDEGDIRVYVQFTSPSGEVVEVDAFYYQPFTYDDSIDAGADPEDWPDHWVPESTDHPWRARMTPDELGEWTWEVFYSQADHGVSSVPLGCVGSFVCEASDKPGFVELAPSDSRYLQFTDGTHFFPIGPFLSIPQSRNYDPEIHQDFERWIHMLADNGANFGVIEMTPDNQFELELEVGDLGNYDATQYRAHDLDQILRVAEQRGVYLELLLLMNYNHFRNSGDAEYGWDLNPYHLDVAGVDEPADFFAVAEAKDLFKQKLRYVLSRWGYSPNILSLVLVDEVDMVRYDIDEEPDYLLIQDDVRQWHEEMAAEIKSRSDRMLVSASYLQLKFDEVVLAMPDIDYTRFHWFKPDPDLANQQNVYTGYMVSQYHTDIDANTCAKPVRLASQCIYKCGASDIFKGDPWGSDFHNALWSHAFSGALGPPSYFHWYRIADDTPFGGTLIADTFQKEHWRYYKALSRFLQGEDLLPPDGARADEADLSCNTVLNRYEPAAGLCTPYSLDPDVVEVHNATGTVTVTMDQDCRPNWKRDPVVFPDFWDSYASGGFFVEDGSGGAGSEVVEVFGLRRARADRMLGWIHNKTHYWYRLQGDDDVDPDPDPVQDLVGYKLFVSVPTDSEYTVEWWDTYYDFTQETDPVGWLGNGCEPGECVDEDDGGILYTATVTPTGGILEIDIPDLIAMPEDAALAYADILHRPDYAFKIFPVSSELPVDDEIGWQRPTSTAVQGP